MSKDDIPRVDRSSADIVQERIEALRELVPEAFGEDGLDVDKLRAAIGEFVDDAPERYQFTWSGKREAIQAFQIPSRATLAPDRENSVNWDETGHVFIEGENLEVLKLLYKSYFGRVKMIYIDPPYNTGNDFVYPDDYADPLEQYLRITGQKDSDGNLLTSNPETSGRYHSAWLSMMYPRLFLARQLLTEDGVIFVSIDDNEVHNLRMLMNEVFGEENFVASVIWQKRTSPDARAKLGAAHDYVLVYARSLESFKDGFGWLPLTDDRRQAYGNPDNDPRGDWASRDITGQTGHATPSQFYEITTPSGRKQCPPAGRCWAISESTFESLVADGRIWFGKDGDARPRLKLFLSESQGMACWTWWPHQEVGHNEESARELNGILGASDIFNNPKPKRLIQRMLMLTTAPDERAVVLDFFSGSCTTAQAVLDLNREDGGNRRFVMVQLPEPTTREDFPTIADIGRERIRRVIARMQGAGTHGREGGASETPEDLGFRAYQLQPSNYRAATETETEGAPALFTDPLVAGWTPNELLHEIAIKEGLDLSALIEQVPDIETNTVYRISDPYKEQTCLVCLDDTLDPETPRALGLTRDDLFICLDAALDDTLAANLALQCRLKII